jgi:hypothetical protein
LSTRPSCLRAELSGGPYRPGTLETVPGFHTFKRVNDFSLHEKKLFLLLDPLTIWH